MSVELYRETATGAIDSTSQLGDEVSAATGVAVEAAVERGLDMTGNVDETKDRVRFWCASLPDEPTLDAALSAYPATTPYLPESLAVVRNVRADLLTFCMLEGTVRTYDIRIRGHIGSGSELKGLTVDVSGESEYPTGSSLLVPRPLNSGPNNRLRVDASATGNVVTLRVRSTVTGTIHFSAESSVILGGPLS